MTLIGIFLRALQQKIEKKLTRRLQNKYSDVHFPGTDHITNGRLPRYPEVARILEEMPMRFMETQHTKNRDTNNIRAPAASRLRDHQGQPPQRVFEDQAVAQLGPVVPRMRREVEATSQGVFVDVEDITE